MPKLLIISSRVNAITQTVVEFSNVRLAEEAIAEIDRGKETLAGVPVSIIIVRLYDPYKEGAKSVAGAFPGQRESKGWLE
jgi:hypothetical protein